MQRPSEALERPAPEFVFAGHVLLQDTAETIARYVGSGSQAEVQRRAHLRLLLGVKQT
jgi:hypothetical protein